MIAFCLIPIGILMIVYTKQVVDFTGTFDFAEKFFVSGGTYTFIKLLGLSISILSFVWLTGGLQAILRSTLGPLFGIS